MRKILVHLWASPATLIGVVLSLFFDRRYVTRGVLLAEGARWPRRFGWRYRAITFGHAVLCVDEIDGPTMDHELAHVRQYERWGLLMLLVYPLSSLRALIEGKHPYRDNAFEVEARAGRR